MTPLAPLAPLAPPAPPTPPAPSTPSTPASSPPLSPTLASSAAPATSTRPLTVAERRGLAVFLALAFGLSWSAQVAVALWSRTIASQPQAAALGASVLLVAVALMWPPAVGAYVARRWVERSGFGDAGLRRPAWRFVGMGWFGPPVLTLVTLLLSLPLYPFDPGLGPLKEMAERAGQPLPVSPELIAAVQLLVALTVAVPINMLFAFGEEFGWRGYLLPRLRTWLGTRRALVAHGAIWGFWHAPLILLAAYNYPGHPVLGVPLFVVAGTLMGILLGRLTLASGSVWPAVVAHASLNATAGAPLLVLRGVDPAPGGVLYSPLGWVVMLAVIAAVAVLARRR